MTRRTRVFLASLLAVVLLIVAYDLWRASRPVTPEPPPLGVPAAPEVRRGLDRSPLLFASEVAAELAQRAVRFQVWLDAVDIPGAPIRGVVIPGGEVVVAPIAASREWRVQRGSEPGRGAQMVASDPVHGVALLRVAGQGGAPMPFARREPDWRQPMILLPSSPMDPQLSAAQSIGAPGSFDALAAILRRQPASPGDLVVNLEGELVAFAGAAVDGVTPLSVAMLQEIVAALRTGGVHRHPWTGAHLQVIDARLRPRFPDGTLAVVHVEPGSPAAGRLVPGSVFAAVEGGGERATSSEHVNALTRRESTLAFIAPTGTVIDVPVGDRQVPDGFTVGEEGVRVSAAETTLTVAPQSDAAVRGLRTGDVLRQIDLRPPGTPAQVRAALTGPRDRLLTVQRGDQWRFVFWPGRGGAR